MPLATEPATPPRHAFGEADSELDRLLRRAQRGDADAWSGLVRRLEGLVYSVPRRYRLDEDTADDVLVVTFEALHANLDRISGGRALPRWLATTAARECLRLLRLRERHAGLSLDEVVAVDEADAEAEAIRADDAFRLRAALGAMAPRCRDLLTALFAEEEAAYSDVSERLGVPIGAIGPTRARCLDKLRRTLEAEGFFV